MGRRAPSPVAPLLHGFFGKDRQNQPLGVANDCQGAARADLRVGQQTMQIIHARDWLFIACDGERHDHVAFAQTRGARRASVFNSYHAHAGFPRKRIEAHYPAMNRNCLRRDSDVTAPDSSIAQQAAGNEFCCIDSDRETDSLGRQDRRRVDSYYLASGVDERAAGISWVQGGIGLNDVLDQAPGVRTQRAPERADHARGYRGLESVGIADRNRHLPRTQLLRISEGNGLQSGSVSINSNDREIGRWIVSDGVSWSAPAVGQRYLDPGGVVHHVAVGENQSIGREDEAGAAASAFARTSSTRGSGHRLMHFNVHYRRTDSFNRGCHRP